MIKIQNAQDIKRLRRIALSAQKLNTQNPFGKGLAGTQKAVEHLGYVQLDTISVVERAHHHVMFSRVDNYRDDMLNQLLKKAHIFEYWSHAAAYLPIADYRFSLPYKHAIKSGQTHWHKQKDTALMDELVNRIKCEGPLRSRDIENNQNKRSGWWDWKPAKKALEQLFMEGDLMVSDRSGFQKTYDLTERVLPTTVNSTMPSIIEFAQHMLGSQFRCHGLVSQKCVTYLRRNKALKQAVKTVIESKLAQKEIEAIELVSGEIYYVLAGTLDKPMPRVSKGLSILSPFDNVLIQRMRLKHIFNFDYQIECYLPEAKRQYGYFSLPLLYQDSFIGRMDCKAHRKTKILEIKSLHFADTPLTNKTNLDEKILHAFVKSLGSFKEFQQCEQIKISNVNPTKYTTQISAALAR